MQGWCMERNRSRRMPRIGRRSNCRSHYCLVRSSELIMWRALRRTFQYSTNLLLNAAIRTDTSHQSVHLILLTISTFQRCRSYIQHKVRLGAQVELLTFCPKASEHKSLSNKSLLRLISERIWGGIDPAAGDQASSSSPNSKNDVSGAALEFESRETLQQERHCKTSPILEEDHWPNINPFHCRLTLL
jgi:hypothetical protein